MAVKRRPKLLVLRALGLGDLLTVLPALRALHDGFPDHELALATSGWLEPLVRHSGTVNAVLPARPFEPLPFHAAGADVAVNLHGRGPESHRQLLAAAPRRLLAFAHADVPESAGGPPHREDEHEVERWCRLLRHCGLAADPARLELAPPAVSLPAEAAGATLIHPGAASGARRWPGERFAAVARAERAAGRHVVITGGRDEIELAHSVAARAGLTPSAVWAGRTNLLELAGLVAQAARVVCGDTGVGHLATALGTPSVLLFGPTPPSRWGPPPGRPKHRALWAGRPGDPHAAEPADGLLAIGVEDVLAALADLDALAVAA